MTLADFVAPKKGAPMVWGVNDCCLVISDWALARTGIDPMSDLRGTYLGWKQAAGVWRRLGGLEKAICDRLDPHFARVGLWDARPGDIAIAQTHTRHVSGCILDLSGVWLPLRDSGYSRHPAPLKTIWRIP